MQGTFRWRHPVFMAGIRLCIDLLSEAWLNWCRRRDTAILSAATVKRQTGVVSGDLNGRILGTGNKAPRGIVCLLFSTSRPRSLWSLPPLHSPVIPPSVAVCVCLPSCPARAHCVRVGGGGFELPVRSKAWTKTKRNAYTCIMRTPTSDWHFKDKIVRIILEIYSGFYGSMSSLWTKLLHRTKLWACLLFYSDSNMLSWA